MDDYAIPRGPRTWVFSLLTLIYLAGITIGAYKLQFFDPTGTAIDPNEWGDVLAGVFSPLAFLWLVYASLSQRTELELQRNELAKNNNSQIVQYQAMQAQAAALQKQGEIMLSQANDIQMARRIWVRSYLKRLMEFHHQIINHTARMVVFKQEGL